MTVFRYRMSPIIVLGLLIVLGLPAVAEVESPSYLSSVGCKVQETELGDLAADAVRAAGGTPVALVPAGSFRELTIPKGTVKTEDVLKCLQYPDDQVAVIEVTGEQLYQALERSVSIYPQKNLGFLQVSGIAFAFDPKLPKGSRILSVKVGKDDMVGSRKYRIATTVPLADGAYGYFTIWGKDLPQQLKEETAARAVTDFLSQRSSVDYREKNRISPKKR